jgi:hypothetical protein
MVMMAPDGLEAQAERVAERRRSEAVARALVKEATPRPRSTRRAFAHGLRALAARIEATEEPCTTC